MLNPLDHSVLFDPPLRIARSTWLTHVPFAMYLIDILRPSLVVELGTYTGVSYCAFCQAVKKLELACRCSAIDTWQGDPQQGSYEASVYSELRAYHDPIYGQFSQLVRKAFDQAVSDFADASIDLLHIDGLHTYEAVANDFDTWLPKLSSRAVVLFHDTQERAEGFGVWHLWEELSDSYPSFEFRHGHGLGLLAVGPESPPLLHDFLVQSPDEAERVQEFFSCIGAAVELRYVVDTLSSRLSDQIEAVNWLQENMRECAELQKIWSVRLARAVRRYGLAGVGRRLPRVMMQLRTSSRHRNWR